MKVLITGIAGLLGGRFADWILRNQPNVEIVGVDDLSCGYYENVPAPIRSKLFRAVPLGQAGYESLEFVIDRYDCKPDVIFHFAAYAAEGLSPFVRRYNYLNNLLATAEVVNAAINHKVQRLVFTSSMAVYGRGSGPPFAEHDQPHPVDPYGVAKLACEQDIQIAGEQHHLDWCIVRPHNIYGPGQSLWQKYRNVLGLWMAATLQNEPIQVFGDGKQQRAFSYIDDILPCLWQAAVAPEANREIINLGGVRPTTILDAAQTVSQITGNPRIVHAEPRYEVRNAWATAYKSQELLGYQETTTLSEGIVQMWNWAQDAWQAFPERRRRPDMKIEVNEGLYSYWKK